MSSVTYLINKSVLFCLLSVIFISAAAGQGISILSGNGQVVSEQFLTNLPLTVQIKDGAGNPVSGVQVTWTITQGSGSLVGQSNTTDAKGQASTFFLGTNIQPGYSFVPDTVTASSPFGNVNFAVTTSLGRQPNGNFAAPPLVELLSPTIDNRTLTGAPGATLPSAVVVQVTAQSGSQAGTPVPNVSLRIVNGQDSSATAPALCNTPTGVVLTDPNGRAVCNLKITGAAGFYPLGAIVGEYQNTPFFNLNVTQPPSCTYAISSSGQSFGPTTSNASVNVTTASGCNWTSSSNANWITISSGAAGNGNGSVRFNIAANPGPLRIGTLLIAGQTFTITQGAVVTGGGPLAITSAASLPGGSLNSGYITTIVASGGQPPYTWSSSGALPPGLSFSSSTGALSGTPTAVGNYTFTATVADAAGRSRSQAFTLNIAAQSAGPVITNSGFPGGVIGQPYQQTLSSSGGCSTPFTGTGTFRVSSGALPGGLAVQAVSGTGYAITGTPTASGTFTFALTVTDACGQSSSSSFAITIGGAAVLLTTNPTTLSFKDSSTQVLSVMSTGSNVAFIASTVGGNWLSVTPSNATTPAVLSVAANTAGLAAGSYSAAVSVATPGGTGVIIPVNLVVSPPAVLDVNPKTFTFTHQFGFDVAEPPRPVFVSSSGAPIAFSASTDQPWLAISPAGATTPANISVSVKPAGLSTGSYTGTVQFGQGVAVQVTLTVIAPPPTVTNAATFIPGPVSPGEIITLFGSNLGPATPAGLHATGEMVDAVLADTRVLFDGVPAPLIYVSGPQISTVVPYEVAGRAVTQMQVEYKGSKGSSVQLPVVAAVPGIFPNAVLNQDSTLNSIQNGAEPGSIIVFYATGEGQTDPPGVTGKIAGNTLPQPKLKAAVTIGGKNADVLYVGAAPGMTAGVIQVNARVPDDVPRGADASLVLTIGDFTSQSGVTVAIRP